jgi:phospholipid/cholesterol/gamma-HCH transport system substrate-binding protein
MERNAHYALVGAISLLIMVGAVAFVFWFARFSLNRQYDIYDVDFRGQVRGLSQGGQVFFNGIRVGEVTKLSLDQADPNRVVARIRTATDAPVRVDSTATLEPLGITGVNYIEISAGTVTKPLLKVATPSDSVPVIHTKQGALESLLEGGGDVLTRAVETLDQVKKLLSDKNIKNVAGTLQDVHDFTTTLKSQKDMLADLDATIKSANATSDKLGKLADSLNGLANGDAKKTLSSLNDAAGEIKATATDIRSTVSKLQGPTSDFASSGLPRITQAIISLQQAAESLNRVVQEIESNPQGVLSKAPAKEREVKP